MTAQFLTSESADATLRAGYDLGRGLSAGDVVLLHGQLGAGKSVLARGIGEALGVTRWKGSPTFTLVNEYRGHPPLVHVDLYRLSGDDVDDLGLEEYLEGDSVLVVEWPERAPGYFTARAGARIYGVDLVVLGPDARQITIERIDGTDEASRQEAG